MKREMFFYRHVCVVCHKWFTTPYEDHFVCKVCTNTPNDKDFPYNTNRKEVSS